jgi:acyl-CoA synthetase (AMP-forming)/AMP-acid ligase II
MPLGDRGGALRAPGDAAGAVIGIPDEKMGEEVGAAVSLKDGAEVSEKELRGDIKRQVGRYKYPRLIWFVDELAKGPTARSSSARSSHRRRRLKEVRDGF